MNVKEALDRVDEIVRSLGEITTSANVGAYPKAFVQIDRPKKKKKDDEEEDGKAVGERTES